MISKPLSYALYALNLSLSASALAADSVKINDLLIAGLIPAAQREATVKAVRAFQLCNRYDSLGRWRIHDRLTMRLRD